MTHLRSAARTVIRQSRGGEILRRRVGCALGIHRPEASAPSALHVSNRIYGLAASRAKIGKDHSYLIGRLIAAG